MLSDDTKETAKSALALAVVVLIGICIPIFVFGDPAGDVNRDVLPAFRTIENQCLKEHERKSLGMITARCRDALQLSSTAMTLGMQAQRNDAVALQATTVAWSDTDLISRRTLRNKTDTEVIHASGGGAGSP